MIKLSFKKTVFNYLKIIDNDVGIRLGDRLTFAGKHYEKN